MASSDPITEAQPEQQQPEQQITGWFYLDANNLYIGPCDEFTLQGNPLNTLSK